MVEIMIVVAIIGVLSSISFVVFSSVREKTRMNSAKMFEANHVGTLRNYLVAEWKFDECTGAIANDNSGSGAHLTLVGNPIWSTNTPSKTGCALDFNGSTQYAYTADNEALDLDNNFTASAWIYLRSDSPTVFFEKANGTLYGAYMGYGWDNNGFIFGSDNANNAPFSSKDIVRLNKWHFVTGTVGTDGERKLYVDGNYISSDSSGYSGWNNALNFYVAYHYTGSYKANMIIDNIRVYSSILTASEIQKLYAEESSQRKLAEAK